MWPNALWRAVSTDRAGRYRGVIENPIGAARVAGPLTVEEHAMSDPISDPNRTDPYRDEPGQPGATAVLDRKAQEEEAEAGDHDRFSHYVRKDKIMKSALGGNAVVALCGKVWVPGRDPEKYPVCPQCKEIYDQIKRGESGDDNGEGTSGHGGGFRGFFGGRR